jgi:ABC-type glutathione transport system ATPase component
MSSASAPLLEVQHLTVRFGTSTVVNDVSFAIALVGESGSGKSITALSVLRLTDAAQTAGAIRFEGEDLLGKSEREMRALRGGRIGMIFQEPMTALNPLFSIGNQIGEVLQLHEGLGKADARARAIELLRRTGIPEPDSPTMPSVCPRFNSSVARLTARNWRLPNQPSFNAKFTSTASAARSTGASAGSGCTTRTGRLASRRCV